MVLKVTLVILHCMMVCSLLVGEHDSTNDTVPEAIIGGRPAKIKDFPFLVSMNFIISRYHYDHWCCGFLLTPSWVGTAAHCLIMKTKATYRTTIFFLIAGTTKIKKMDSLYQLRFPEYFVPHPDFSWKNLHHDIGLIKVRRPFSFNDNMGLAIFPKNSYTLKPWRTCVLAGWGLTEKNKTSTELLFADPYVLPENFCSWSIGNVFFNPKGTICTISGRRARGSCKGDSGSPLLCDLLDAEGEILAPDLIDIWMKEGYSPKSEQRKVVGIVSWGMSCVEPGVPIVYTDTRHYRSWMREVVHNSSPSLYCMRIVPLLILSIVFILSDLLLVPINAFIRFKTSILTTKEQ